ncbi:polyprenol monophosphomannose synthase [Marinitenerispora sediminis]|uniref:Polyprenol monophosphomannose synthase n=1 Tax=Marinitenerispora sediminis TaxID=1931232 RepID=A0A368T2B7_9ACTN|nr:polyprenol monophosphomannose synthase [Marinitenerispora sediminis]RCV52117.1 polyprenol monophosphomannose synthase [Marinitenerispora sediminis]RCV55526.1 polyprenol monophosphomannose synthase [Marinitenerispora sediminis]RCV57830.1 polyprenol monophosphomannose synthase [Marinitenerispora sediminis]
MSSPVTLPEPWSRSAVSVVVPTYNEAANLPVLVERVLALGLPNLRLVIVDDNSPDGTGEVADKLAAEYAADGAAPGGGGAGQSPITVLHRTAKDGLGRAYVAGMTRALRDGADFVAQMDADLSHPPGYLPQMLGTALSTNAGVVIGSRYVAGGSLSEHWGLRRRLLSGWANAYVKAILAMPIRDVTAGYKLWRRSALEALDLAGIHSSGYSFQVEMHFRAYRRGQKMVEIPIHFEDRQEGSSKMDLAVQLESALRPFQLRRTEGARRTR